ncbi:hypothetical protein ACFL6E_06605 [Candidatus Neomarinimicrobiota bacterium]
MTWGSFLTRVLSLILVLPLILTRLEVGEIALWYLFSTIIALQFVLDMGFGVTFARVIAYAFAGSDVIYHTEMLENVEQKSPNWDKMAKIVSTMRGIYLRLSAIYVLLLITFGTLAVLRPIAQVKNPTDAKIAWVIIIAVAGVSFFGSSYSNYVQGLNKIALIRRWDSISSLATILTSFYVLLRWENLLYLVIAHQSWAVINVIRNRYLARHIEDGQFIKNSRAGIDRATLKELWPSTWRSGLGVLMSQGVVSLSGIIYSQFGDTNNVAAYFLGIRLIQAIRGFSMAPFYSRLYLMAQLRAKGDTAQQLLQAQKGMQLSYWTFVLSFIIVGLFADQLLLEIGSNAAFVGPVFWSLLGLGYFLERYGAMHIQLYTASGIIIWHIANGVTGLINISFLLLLFGHFDYYAIPMAYLIANAGFYSWYSASHSYRLYKLNIWQFEKLASLPAAIILILYIIFTAISK